MSLLMDALKKAETAKQGTPSPPPSTSGNPAASSSGPATDWPVLSVELSPAEIESELGFAPVKSKAVSVPTPAVEPKAAPVIGLEPLHLSITPLAAPASSSAAPPSASPASAAQPPQGDGAGGLSAGVQAAERRAAKSVFSAKRPVATGESSRLPFFAIIGMLLVAGAGGAYYLWSQLQGPATPALVAPSGAASGVINAPAPLPAAGAVAPTNGPAAPAATPATPTATAAAPPPSTSASAASAVAATPAAAAAPPATNRTADIVTAPAPGATSGAPGPPVLAAPAARAPAITTQSAGSEPAAQGRAPSAGARTGNPASARAGNSLDAPSNLRISRDRAPSGIDPAVAAGYAALADGNLDAAREHYSRALTADPANRDALLGLATIAARSGRTGAAESLYQRVLEIQPRDPYASAQLSALRSGNDASGAESRVKNLLANEDDKASAAPLHFALGNQMAAQSRWAEAQQAYFNAFAAEPDNPDYCFNLAVSLDQIRQPKLAYEHYARALELAQKRRAGFDPARAKLRLDQLASSAK